MAPLKCLLNILFRFILNYFRYPLPSLQAQQYATKAYSPIKYHWTLGRLFYHLYLFIICIRLILFSAYNHQYTPHDWLAALMRHYISHHLLGIALVPFTLTFSYFDFKLIITPVVPVAKLLVELLIANKFKLPSSTVEKFTFIASLIRKGASKKTTDIQYNQPLYHYQSLSTSTRFKLALANEIIEYIYRVYVSVIRLAALILYLYSIINARSFDLFKTSFQLILAIADSAFLLLAFTQVASIAISQHFFFIITLTIYWHTVEVMKTLLKQYGRVGNSVLIQLLATYRRQHSLVLTDLVSFNRHIASGLLFALVAANLVFNVYFISILLFLKSLDPLLRDYMVVGIITQIIAVPLLLVQLSAIVKVLYSTENVLYRSQYRLVGCTREKLKLLYYYELINSEERFCYTLGSGIKIIGQRIPELILLYSAYMMFCFQLFLKQQQQQAD